MVAKRTKPRSGGPAPSPPTESGASPASVPRVPERAGIAGLSGPAGSSKEPATTAAAADDAPAKRRAHGPELMAVLVPSLASRALGKKGLALGSLIGDWSSLVGARLAGCTIPHRLALPRGQKGEGTLYLRVSGGAALELAHAEPQIIERINSFFGFRAVARLKLVQAPPPSRKPGPPPRPLTAAEERSIHRRLAMIEDPGLRDSLLRLGRSLAGRSDPKDRA